jgi:serine/threonine protein phosphatase PrpC
MSLRDNSGVAWMAKAELVLQADFDQPHVFEEKKSLIYFSKKSPFKDTCNEDAIGIFPVGDGMVLVVADGAGGHPKGEEAAKRVLEQMDKHLKSRDTKAESLRIPIINAIEQANKELLDEGIGARTTVTVCEVFNNKARGYQVGDSTLFICGLRGKIKYKSTSHSPVGYGIEAGLIDEHEALDHPDLHYISNLVGESGMKIEIGPEIELNPKDSVFLASDGLFDNFHPNQIVEIVRKGELAKISSELMNSIDEKIYKQDDSKKDDISFILFKNE